MQAKVEVISLAYAKQLLEANTQNRPVSPATVRRYADDMRAGRWNNNGQGIVITPDGELLDGQHRLHAIIASQKPISMLVVRGVPAETFITMDSGKARSLSDVLAIEGYVHANTLAAAARYVYSYAANIQIDGNPTKATLEAFVKAHPYGVEACGLVHGERVKFPRAPFAAVVWLANERRVLDEEARSFIDGVFYGEGLFKGDARHTLREWLIAQRSRERFTLTQRMAFGAIGRAWNAYASGKELLVIKGITNVNHGSMKLYGFERHTYKEVPDLAAGAELARRTNLAKGSARSPLMFATEAA